MLKLTSPFQLSSIPPPYRQTVTNAIQNLCSILGPDPAYSSESGPVIPL